MNSSGRTKNRFSATGVFLLAAIIILSLQRNVFGCCGSVYPPFMLRKSGEAINTMPGGVFEQELKRIGLVSNMKFKAVPRQKKDEWHRQSYNDQNYQTGISDFKIWLNASKLPENKRNELLTQYEALREELKERQRELRNITEKGYSESEEANAISKLPKLPIGLVGNDFPAEFRDYLKGSICWYNGDVKKARQCWKAVLSLPVEKRKFRTLWAAYMLARSEEDTNPAEAIKRYQNVRKIAAKGFYDSLGLAVASMGREARLELKAGNYKKAIHLYLAQYLAGDDEAINSLSIVLSRLIFKRENSQFKPVSADAWASLLKDQTILRLSIAYVAGYVQRGYSYLTDMPEDSLLEQFVLALTKAGYLTKNQKTGQLSPARKIPQADRLAWIAYRAGKFQLAQDFLMMANKTPIARWVQAKLYLRQGQTRKALEEYQSLTRQGNTPAIKTLCCGVMDVDYWGYEYAETPVIWRAAGEYGSVLVSRKQYEDAMKVFLHNGWWEDAAYIAERILTPDELLAFVRKNYPEKPKYPGKVSYKYYARFSTRNVSNHAANLRHLLARRLTRIGRWKEAREFYPTEKLRKMHTEYIDAIRAGHDMSRSKSLRAAGFFKAARLARYEGMQILGTELDPDNSINGGNFGEDNPPPAQETIKFLRTQVKPYQPTNDEVTRYIKSATSPNKRYHYRYIAADHAWQAAELMPDNDPQTAMLLYKAGCWLKDKDPKAADKFYKALVNRCGKTPLGRAADKKRWFPSLPEEENK